MLVWLENAAMFNVVKDDEVTTFVKKIITCQTYLRNRG